MSIHESRSVVTRKEHKCWGCRRAMPAGSTMRVVTSKDSDGFSRGYWCDVCDRVLADMDVHYDDTFGYGEVFDNERDDWQKVAAAMKGESDG